MMPAKNFEPGPQSDSCYMVCPYCGLESGDADEYLGGTTETNSFNEVCYKCGKRYKAWAEYSVDYYTEPLED